MKQYDSGEIVDQAAAVPEQLPFNPVFKPVPAVIPPKIAMFDFTQKYQEMFDLSPTPASFGRAVVLRSKATGMAYVLKVLQSRAVILSIFT